MVDRREEILRHPFDRLSMEVIQGAGQGEQGTGNSRRFVSPGGRWVAYARQKKLWKVPVECGTAIEVLSIKSGTRKVLLTGGVCGFYVPTGHLLFAVGETIRDVPSPHAPSRRALAGCRRLAHT